MVWVPASPGRSELRVAPRGQPAAQAVDLETIENVIVIVLDGPQFELEVRGEQSDNESWHFHPE
jgi:hypothetical protein